MATSKAVRLSVEKALRYLRHTVFLCQNTGTNTLTTVDGLARSAGVSRMTMWRAVRQLCDEGVLQTGKGRPITIAGDTDPKVDPVVVHEAGLGRRSKWRRMSGSLARAIIEGTYAPGSHLPTVKELCRRHGGCHRTLAKALDDLCLKGYLSVAGRRYQVRSTAEHRGYRPYIALVAFGDFGRIALPSPRSHDQFRALETACRSHGLDLVTITGDFVESKTPSVRSWAATLRRIRQQPPLGIVLWTIAFWDARIRAIMEYVKQTGVPAAVLIEAHTTAVAWQAYAPLRVRTFTMAISPTAGQDMGRYLLGLGHRRVAHVGGGPDPSPRLRGLCSAFEHAGVPDGVVHFDTVPQEAYPQAYEVEALLRQAPAALQAQGLANGRTAAVVARTLDGLLAQASWVIQRPGGSVEHDATTEAILADDSISAVVGDTDIIALECLRRLVERGIEIPVRLSVAGYDDSIAAMAFGLTSYSFNGEGVAQAMLAHILNPQPVTGTTEIGGTVIERRTTGPARAD